MATKAPPRPWFRLASLRSSTAPPPAPTPEPPPPQARPPLTRPAFQPASPPQPLPTQSQKLTTAASPPTTTSVPESGAEVTSVPRSSATSRVSPLPTSPVPRPASAVGSVPTSPAPRPSAPSSSLPTFPAPAASVFPAATTSSGRASPKLASASLPPSSNGPGPASVRPSPTPRAVATTYSLSDSPVPKAVTTAPRVPNLAPSPITINPAVQTPSLPPTPKPTAPPPSRLTLPPSLVKSDAEPEPKIQLVAEPKTTLVQKTFDKPKAQKDSSDSLVSSVLGKQEVARNLETKAKDKLKKVASDSEGLGMRVITIAGNYEGAFMEIIYPPQKHGVESRSHLLHRGGNPKEGTSSTNGEQENGKKKDKDHSGKAMDSLPVMSFTNSNVQSVNNSIMYNSSCASQDPGVHLSLYRRNPAGAGLHVAKGGGSGREN